MKTIKFLLIIGILMTVFSCEESIIKQDPTLSISPAVNILDIPAEIGNESYSFTVTTNEKQWQVKSLTIDSLWCQVSVNKQASSFTIKPLTNTLSTERVVMLEISGVEAPYITLTVRQKAGSSHSTNDYEYENGTTMGLT